MTLHEILKSLHQAGLRREYLELREYIAERDAMIVALTEIELKGHEAGVPLFEFHGPYSRVRVFRAEEKNLITC